MKNQDINCVVHLDIPNVTFELKSQHQISIGTGAVGSIVPSLVSMNTLGPGDFRCAIKHLTLCFAGAMQ